MAKRALLDSRSGKNGQCSGEIAVDFKLDRVRELRDTGSTAGSRFRRHQPQLRGIGRQARVLGWLERNVRLRSVGALRRRHGARGQKGYSKCGGKSS